MNYYYYFIFRSENYGTSFIKNDLPSDAVVDFIYSSPIKKNQVSLNKKKYIMVYTWFTILWTCDYCLLVMVKKTKTIMAKKNKQ